MRSLVLGKHLTVVLIREDREFSDQTLFYIGKEQFL